MAQLALACGRRKVTAWIVSGSLSFSTPTAVLAPKSALMRAILAWAGS